MQCWSSDRELLVGLRLEWGEGAGEGNEFVFQMNMHVVQLVLHGLEENCVEQLSRSACVRVLHNIVHALSGLFASEGEMV